MKEINIYSSLLKKVLTVLLVIALCQSTCKKSTSDCIGKAIPGCICTMDYKPVCGCDGKVYSNACVAKCAGVKKNGLKEPVNKQGTYY